MWVEAHTHMECPPPATTSNWKWTFVFFFVCSVKLFLFKLVQHESSAHVFTSAFWFDSRPLRKSFKHDMQCSAETACPAWSRNWTEWKYQKYFKIFFPPKNGPYQVLKKEAEEHAVTEEISIKLWEGPVMLPCSEGDILQQEIDWIELDLPTCFILAAFHVICCYVCRHTAGWPFLQQRDLMEISFSLQPDFFSTVSLISTGWC